MLISFLKRFRKLKSTYYLFLGKATALPLHNRWYRVFPPTPAIVLKTNFVHGMLCWLQRTLLQLTLLLHFLVETGQMVLSMICINMTIIHHTTSTSGATNLYDSTFFFMTSDYNVYKVLDNNGGAAYNGAEPTSTQVTPLLHWWICH